MSGSSVYGFCPQCGAPGKIRERRINGNDTCVNGHKYKSTEAVSIPMPSAIVTRKETKRVYTFSDHLLTALMKTYVGGVNPTDEVDAEFSCTSQGDFVEARLTVVSVEREEK